MSSTANLVSAIALTYVGATPNGTAAQKKQFKEIINTFNTVKPHGYKALTSDPWCAEAWTAWQIMAGNKQTAIPMSASCTQLIADAKKLNIWVENEKCVPQIGWGVIYDWQDGSSYASTDNQGAPDHVGIIYAVDKNYFYVVEGNKGTNHMCGKRAVAINGRYIRGFIAPKYAELKASEYKPSTPYSGKLPASVVHYGSSGTDAGRLQEFLNWCIDAKLVVDSQFGRKSTAALLVYQKTYGLVADGFFGDASKAQAQKVIDNYNKPVPMPYPGTMPALDKVVIDNQKKLADMATKLAYTTNTSKAKYPDGKPTEAYKAALAKLPAKGHNWNAPSAAGASCDVYVWTVIRTSGVATPARAGLWYLTDWLKKSSVFIQIKTTEVMPGDIGMYRKNTKVKHGHIYMCMDSIQNPTKSTKGQVKEASHGDYYPKTTNSLKDRMALTDKKKYVIAFRAVNTVTEAALKIGSHGENVKNLQKYLNWYFQGKYGKDVLAVDGSFGTLTDKYLKLFQTEQGLVADGICGTKTLKKMKEVAI